MNGDVNLGDTFTVDKAVTDVSPEDYDALIVPGGTVGADNLRGDASVVQFVHGFFEQAKPVGVICHGPWTLVEADVVKGRTLTSYPTLQTDIRNAGGNWVDEEVVTDQGLVTSRNPTTCRPSAPRSSRRSARASTRSRPVARREGSYRAFSRRLRVGD